MIWLFRNSRATVKSAPYRLVRKQGVFEIRDYPALILVTTPMQEGGMNGSFGRLFRFITGHNAEARKIPMTTPVLIDHAPTHSTMSFVMSGATRKSGVPAPTEPGVRLEEAKPTYYVAMRFGGLSDAKNEQRAVAKLRKWLDEHKIAARGAPVFAYYDPPWTPPFLRRNEVMVGVSEAVGAE